MVWDPSPSRNVAYYRIYYGTASRVYNGYVQVNAPTTTAVIPNLIAGTTYYFAVKGVEAVGTESGFSNEATHRPPITTLGPTANSFTLATAEESPINVTLSGSSGSGNPLTYSIKTLPGKGTLSGVGPNLVYTPSANSFGTDQFTYNVSDGVGTASATVTINVAAVNDAPTINAPAGIIIAQNAGPQVVPLTGITSGSPNEAQTLTVTAKSSSPLIAPDPIVNYASPSTTGSLTFTPNANANGWVTFTVTVTDNGGANNVTTKSFWVLVNNPPKIDPIADISVIEDSGTRSVALTGIGAGAANETNQVVWIGLQSSNPALIPVPTLNYTNPNTTGSLTFTPTPNSYGSSIITVLTYDSEYGNNMVRREFRITVHGLNDAPTLNPISNISLDPSAGAKAISLTGISSGATNENQNVVVTASSSNPSLVTATVAYTSPNSTGTLTLTPIGGQSGTATVTVTASDGVSLLIRTFTVSIASLPKISGLTVAATDARTLNVTWTTDKTATCVLEYGTTSVLDMASSQMIGTSHSVTLTNLQPGTLYYLRVKATTTGGTATAVATASTEALQIMNVAAENGVRGGSFKVTASVLAQNGKYIAASSVNNAIASYALNLERGLNYRLWARVKTPVGGAPFGVIVDGVERTLFAGDTGAVNQWHWVLLTDNLNRNSAIVYSLEAGPHDLVVRGAAGVWLDEFVFANDPAWKPILPTVGPSLAASRTSSSTATLTWNDPAGNATAYGIEYSLDGINFSTSTNIAVPANGITVGSLGPQTYYFRIYSYNAVDRSAYSNVAAAVF